MKGENRTIEDLIEDLIDHAIAHGISSNDNNADNIAKVRFILLSKLSHKDEQIKAIKKVVQPFLKVKDKGDYVIGVITSNDIKTLGETAADLHLKGFIDGSHATAEQADEIHAVEMAQKDEALAQCVEALEESAKWARGLNTTTGGLDIPHPTTIKWLQKIDDALALPSVEQVRKRAEAMRKVKEALELMPHDDGCPYRDNANWDDCECPKKVLKENERCEE